MITSILLPLQIGGSRDPAADYAISIATEFGSHITAVGFAYDVIPALDMGNDIPYEVVEAEREANKKAAADATARFEQAAKRADVSCETRIIEASYLGAGVVCGELARSFDLVVVGQASPESMSGDSIIEGVLFDSGRPVLVVPYIQSAGLKLDRVTVCWDGSRNAARAIHDAMPLLAKARAVEVVTVTGEKDRVDALQRADIGQYLARHGLNVHLRTIAIGDVDVTNVVLSDAADRGTDLIVMGGYGHSRLREFILGGATRGMLHSMTVPVLMSH